MFASQNGHVKVVTELLRAGACTKAALPDGRTALSIARSKGHMQIVALLEKA
jgi:ankyrin repeat protein